jgi:hypothetical protein
MKRFLDRRGRSSYANVVSTLALFVALGGGAIAATGGFVDSRGVVRACVSKHGAVTVVKARKRCPRHTTTVLLNQAGRPGTAGRQGPPGPSTGPAGGDLAGSFPNPTIAGAAAPTSIEANPSAATDPCLALEPRTGVFCGTSSVHWIAGAFTGRGIDFWRDRLGEVHIRGEADESTGPVGSEPMFILPAGFRPAVLHAFPIAVGEQAGTFKGTAALLLISPTGQVEVSSGAGQKAAFLGEIEFRTDA